MSISLYTQTNIHFYICIYIERYLVETRKLFMKNYLARNEGQRYAIYISFLCLSVSQSVADVMDDIGPI